ncbi:aspartic peptidase domain-containing protein [Trametes elegans]|nr:aspartic peptidase domain-containing protein [Trametes elegans]
MPLIDEMSDAFDVLYYGPMQFGSGQKVLGVDIDTGSADLWVPVDCFNCQSEQYKGRASVTYQRTKTKCTMTYVAGEASGTLASDTVSVGPLQVTNQTFCAVHKESEDWYAQPQSGLIGLAFGSIAFSGQRTFFENLLIEKKVAASVFSVHLERMKTYGSEVCFGCYDPARATGPLELHPIVSRTFWSLAMDGLSLDGRLLPTNLTAAMDTGSSFIHLPEDVAEDLYARIPGSRQAEDYPTGYYRLPCNTTSTLALVFNGKPYLMHQSDFVMGNGEQGEEDCLGSIIAMGGGWDTTLAIIGVAFLKSWYTLYDYAGKIGLSPSINNRESQGQGGH